MSKQTITEFLEARIAEDEGVARFALNKGSGLDVEDFESGDAYARNVLVIGRERVLAECAAKRAIIEEHYWRSAEGARGCGLCNYSRDYGWEETGPCKTVRGLAAVYKDHPDYQQEWAL